MRKKCINLFVIPAVFTITLAGCSDYSNPNNKYQDTTPAQVNTSRGKMIFEQRCQACHGLNGEYRNMNAADLQKSTLDSLGVITTIINGRGKMPMFDHSIPDSDLVQVAEYVMTLRK